MAQSSVEWPGLRGELDSGMQPGIMHATFAVDSALADCHSRFTGSSWTARPLPSGAGQLAVWGKVKYMARDRPAGIHPCAAPHRAICPDSTMKYANLVLVSVAWLPYADYLDFPLGSH